MKVRCSREVKNSWYCDRLVAVFFIGLIVAMFIWSGSIPVSALSYGSGVGTKLTLESSINISLSSADIHILELAPGTVSDSNIITVKVLSNNANGYTLSSSVGSNIITNNNGGSFETRNLIHESLDSNGGGIVSNFASVATDASLTNITADNTWGYSFLDPNESNTWANYSGLPLFSDAAAATLKVTNSPSATLGDDIRFKIAARASGIQPSGDYNNVINFIVIGTPDAALLYNKIAGMSKGTLAENSVALIDDITTPTSTNRSEDVSNSGVYKYDSSAYGSASDANNNREIYFYRGVLEPAEDNGTYGSDGKATTYPNYVKLSNNTCWRIIRTTGSGGVKMIYNGTWSNDSCANNSSGAQLPLISFASQGTSMQPTQWYRNMAYIGYTFNNSVTDSTVDTKLGIILGNNNNLALNNARSNIKTYIEDTWYASNMTTYTGKLEAEAGYCADRSVYDSSGTLLDEDVATALPHGSSVALHNFGTRYRLGANSTIRMPTFNCPRGDVDIYRYMPGSTGLSNELKYPAALLTADEATLAGNGYNFIAANSNNSFLRSGLGFWLLSPHYRNDNGNVYMSYINANGRLSFSNINSSQGVRPVISLKPGTAVTGGTGVSTNPWIVE